MSSSEEKSDVENEELLEGSDKDLSASEEQEESSAEEKGNNKAVSKKPVPSRSARLEKSASEESYDSGDKKRGKTERKKRVAAARVASYADDAPESEESIPESESEAYEQEESEEDEDEWKGDADSGSDFESEMKKGKGGKGKKGAVVKRNARPTRANAKRGSASKKRGSSASDVSDDSGGEDSYVPRPSKRRQLSSNEHRGVTVEGSGSSDGE
uniref:Uncharacterized protein n=1 Tax=Trichuris muris TaxID=70415 RepID=A0A5S6QUG6_TRIMR